MTVTITLEMLRKLKACSDVLNRLQAKYGDSFTASKWEDLIEPISFSEDANWIASRLLSEEGRNAYYAATKPYWDAYDAAVKLHRDAYDAAIKPDRATYEAAIKPHWDAYNAAVKPHWDAYDAAKSTIVAELLFNELKGDL